MSERKAAPWPANEPLPSALTIAQFIRVMDISRSTYDLRAPRGIYDRFKLQYPIDNKVFSGAALERWREMRRDTSLSRRMLRRTVKRRAAQPSQRKP